MMIFGTLGAPLHVNASLERLMATEPGRDAIARAARELAERVARDARWTAGSVHWLGAPGVTLCPHRRTYALSPFLVPAGVFAPTRAVVILAERAAPQFRSADTDVVGAFGLTARQVQVARLLLAHYSAPDIARALTISPHTARHHVERVYRKASVTGRNELRRKVESLRAMPAGGLPPPSGFGKDGQ